MSTQKLLVVLAHPDDESFPIGGTLAKYAQEGVDVFLLTATRGEAGIPGKSAAETATIRESELRRACAELRIHQPIFLDFIDGTLADIPDETGMQYLLAHFRQLQPDVIITFGPDGISGHADHLAIYRWTTLAFDQLKHQANGPHLLYYIAPSEATQQGCGVPPPAEEVGGPVAFIDVGSYLEQKVRAIQQHHSQHPPFTGDPKVEAQKLVCHELFRLARPRLSLNGHRPATDLLTNAVINHQEGVF